MARIGIRLPSMLISVLDGGSIVQIEAATLGEALETIAREHPDLARHLFDEGIRCQLETGHADRYVLVNTAGFPSEKGRATLLFLERLRVTRVEYVSSPEAVRDALGPEPQP